MTDHRDIQLEKVISDLSLTLTRIETQSTASEKILTQLASDVKEMQRGMGEYVKRADLDDLKNELSERWKSVASSSDIKSLEKDLARFESQIEKDRVKIGAETQAIRSGEIRELREQLEALKSFYNKTMGAMAVLMFAIPLIIKYLV